MYTGNIRHIGWSFSPQPYIHTHIHIHTHTMYKVNSLKTTTSTSQPTLTAAMALTSALNPHKLLLIRQSKVCKEAAPKPLYNYLLLPHAHN